jgi:hypothetical protein
MASENEKTREELQKEELVKAAMMVSDIPVPHT